MFKREEKEYRKKSRRKKLTYILPSPLFLKKTDVEAPNPDYKPTFDIRSKLVLQI